MPVPRTAGTPAVPEPRPGGAATRFMAHGAVGTGGVSSRDGTACASTWWTHPPPSVREARHAHLHLVRAGGDRGGCARRYLRSVPLGELRGLTPLATGRRDEVLAWSGGRRTFSFAFSDQESHRCGLPSSDREGNAVPREYEGA